MFYRGNKKHGYASSGAYELNHECDSSKLHAPELVPMFFTAIKHAYRCYISILTQLYLSNVLH